MTEHLDVDEGTVAMRIEHLAGDIPDLIADGEDHLGSRVVAEFGFVDFQPHPFLTLAVGDDLGFGESAHGMVFQFSSVLPASLHMAMIAASA